MCGALGFLSGLKGVHSSIEKGIINLEKMRALLTEFVDNKVFENKVGILRLYVPNNFEKKVKILGLYVPNSILGDHGMEKVLFILCYLCLVLMEFCTTF